MKYAFIVVENYGLPKKFNQKKKFTPKKDIVIQACRQSDRGKKIAWFEYLV